MANNLHEQLLQNAATKLEALTITAMSCESITICTIYVYFTSSNCV